MVNVRWRNVQLAKVTLSLSKTCGLWTLPNCDFSSHNEWNVKTALTDACPCRIESFDPHTSCNLGPRQYVFGDNSALNLLKHAHVLFIILAWQPSHAVLPPAVGGCQPCCCYSYAAVWSSWSCHCVTVTASEQGGFPLQLSLLLVCSGVIVAGGGSGLGQGYIFGFYVFLPLPVNPFLSLICLCLCLSV